MQKKTKEKKVQQIAPEVAEKKKTKRIIKLFIFLALFVAAFGTGFLYPYTKEKTPVFPLPKRTPPTLTKQIIENPLPVLEKVQEEIIEKEEEKNDTEPLANEDASAKDKLILSQTQTIEQLNEKIHRLEIDNLNLKEKMAHQEKLTPLTVKLMEEIYSGRPFGTTLNLLLMYDKTNEFALNVKEKLSAYASVGLPTKEDLKHTFLSQMEIAKKAYYVNKKDASWNERWSAYFKSLVHVYPQKMLPQETHGIDLLFLARTQVLDGQFEAALKSVERLPENAKQFLNGFIQKTHHYLEGKQIIEAYLKK